MSEIRNKITGITIGIRFSRSFRIPDMSGEIIDNILNDPKSPFDAKFFPRINETSTKEKMLFNESGENIKITSDDFIISLKIDNNFEKKVKFIKDDLVKYLILLFDLFAIENIHRIGILFYSSLQNSSQLNDVIKNITNNKVQDIQNFDLLFSRKKKTTEGFIKKGVKDYINTIYTLTKGKKDDKIIFNLDYQKHFSPIVPKLKDVKLEKSFDDAVKSIEEEYENWIKDYDK